MEIREILTKRRQKLTNLYPDPLVLWSGTPRSRNFPANVYPFRASSHFLYFAGISLERAVLFLGGGTVGIFWDAPAGALWHGPSPTPEAIADLIGCDFVLPYAELAQGITSAVATIPIDFLITEQERILGRSPSLTDLDSVDHALARAIVAVRSTQDEAALAEMRTAAAVTVAAHIAGMQATRSESTEAQVRAAMEGVIVAYNHQTAYQSIVSSHGEVLHNQTYLHQLQEGDLLLADVGAESPQGWAADVTRTWPVTGKFSPTQREIYQLVYAAQQSCIGAIRSGVEYRDIHLLGAKILTEGLIDVGILRGNAGDLLAMDVHALFFPHGIGHLLGLDVHDMEDLGDLAGYAPGRQRSDRFGLCYLRLDRPLEAGMVVTIEPGFYQVPTLLQDAQRQEKYRGYVDWERLANFADVRGVRIEDDVLVTETGYEVLTEALPSRSEDIEAIVLS